MKDSISSRPTNLHKVDLFFNVQLTSLLYKINSVHNCTHLMIATEAYVWFENRTFVAILLQDNQLTDEPQLVHHDAQVDLSAWTEEPRRSF